MLRVCSHYKQSRAEQSRAVSSGINFYIVLNVQTLGCSHHKRSGAARSRAEQSRAVRSGNSAVFFAARCERSSAAPPFDQHGQEAINKGEFLLLRPKLQKLTRLCIVQVQFNDI